MAKTPITPNVRKGTEPTPPPVHEPDEDWTDDDEKPKPQKPSKPKPNGVATAINKVPAKFRKLL